MNRRRLLKSLGAGCAIGAFLNVLPSRAFASAASCRVLEINLRGGYSAFDSLLWSARYTGNTGPESLAMGAGAPAPSARTQIGSASVDPMYVWNDALGTPFLSRFADRWRVVAMQHEFQPHEVAMPLALTGTTPGRSLHAGTGAWIKQEAQQNAGDVEPSYVFYREASIDTALFAAKTQGVGDTTAPILVPYGSGGFDLSGLTRTPQTRDGIVAALTDQYAARLNAPGTDDVRSPAFTTWATARGSLEDASTTIHGDIAPHLVSHASPLHAMIGTALNMLESQSAQYVCIVDQRYDTHNLALSQHGPHHRGCLRQVMEALDQLTPGSESDVLVVLTTEFGRGNAASDHWPGGYAQMLIGGPVLRPAGWTPEAFRLAGDVSAAGMATRNGGPGFTPSQFRAGVLSQLGFADADVGVLPDLGTSPTALAAELFPTF